MSATFNLTAARARDLWSANRDTYTDKIGAMVGIIPTAKIVDWVVGELIKIAIEEAPRAWAWFSRKAADVLARIEAAADRLDDRLTWERIANENLRDLFEAHDDLYDLFRGGLSLLLELVEADVANAEEAEGRKILGADGLTGFFRKSPLSLDLRPQLPATRDTIPVSSQAEARALRDIQRELAEARARIAELEAAQIPATDNEIPTIDIEAIAVDGDDAEAEIPALGAASMPLPSPPSAHDTPEPQSLNNARASVLSATVPSPRRAATPVELPSASGLQRRSRTGNTGRGK